VSLFKGDIQKKQNLFTRLFFSFLFFLLVPILGFTLLFQTVITNLIKDEINKSSMNSLILLQDFVDLTINKSLASAINISMDPRLKYLFLLQTGSNRQDIDYVDAVLESIIMLRSNVVTNDSIHSIYLFNEDTGMIVTSGGETVAADTYLDNDWLDSYESGLNKLIILPTRRPVDQTILKEGSVTIDIDRDIYSDVITLIFPLAYHAERSFHGAVVINLRERKLFYPSADEDGPVYSLLDRDGHYLAGHASPEVRTALEDSLRQVIKTEGISGTYDEVFHNQKFMVTYHQSTEYGITVMKITPMTSLFQRVSILQIIISIMALIFVAVGSFFAWRFSRRIYEPIQSTMDFLQRAIGPDDNEKNRDELNQIQQAVEKILQEDEKIHHMLEHSRNSLTESVVLDLIRGDTENSGNVFSDSEASYICLVLMVNKIRQFSDRYSHREQFTFRNLILRLSLEVVNRNATGAGVILGYDKIAIVIQLPPNEKGVVPSKKNRDNLYHEMMQSARVNEELSIILSAGAVHQGWDQVRRSFMEAIEGLAYRISFQDGQYIDYATLPITAGGWPDIEPQTDRLINYLSGGRENDTLTAVDQLIEVLFKDHLVNYERVLELLTPLISRTIGFLRSRNISNSQFLERYRSFYDLIADQETRDDLKDSLISYYKGILVVLNNQQEGNSPGQNILRIIQDNYGNPNLDLTLLADEVNMSYSHTRKLIKDETGLSFVDYLNRIRIGKVRELLADTDKPMRVIAAVTGYHNEQSLTRFFKKYEGVTPGEYRRQNNE
jgi:AraC-like DNA-binding protein